MESSSASEPRLPAQRTVLVIDDDQVDRLMVRELIGNAYSVVEARTGEEARTRLAAKGIDCILLDYRIPGTDSLAFLAECVNLSIPVIILTGEGNEDIAVSALKGGAQDYIKKGSLSDQRLLRTIENSIEHMTLRHELAEKQSLLTAANSELREKVQELERVNGDLQNFIHLAAHDFREPLRTMSSYCDLLQRNLGDGLSEESTTFVNSIRRGARQLAALIDDLRALSKIGYNKYVFEKVDLNEVVQEVLLEFQPQIKASNATIHQAALPTVTGYRVLLRELYHNLLSNALKYGAHSNLQVDLTCEKGDGATVTLGVRNNGCTIVQTEIEQLFQPFSRVSNARSKEGTGLGLSLCKKIIERNGGRIWVEFPAEGLIEFKFTLRIAVDVGKA